MERFDSGIVEGWELEAIKFAVPVRNLHVQLEAGCPV